MRRYEEPPEPRNIIRTAKNNHVGVMGIRAVQAGALTAEIDRPLGRDDPEMRDYAKAAPFRALCRSPLSTSMILRGRPVPVIPQSPISPFAFSFSNAGTTSEKKAVQRTTP